MRSHTMAILYATVYAQKFQNCDRFAINMKNRKHVERYSPWMWLITFQCRSFRDFRKSLPEYTASYSRRL
jgi:hypothetical protein